MTKFIFLNDKIIPETEGNVSTNDRGFLYGDGIYETLRSYKGKPFKLAEHLERMRHSAKQLKISFDYTNADIGERINELIDKNRSQDAYIRITLSRGTGGGRLQMDDNINPTTLIQVKPLTQYDSKLYDEGMSLIISNYRRSTSSPIYCHKSSNLLTSILLKEEAKKRSAHEAIIMNTDEYVAECVVSNIFLVNNGNVVTPSLNTNILSGITRRTVLDICKDSRIPAGEELFKVEALLNADEVFITNSLMEIMPVSKMENYKIGKRIPGNITKQLMGAYKCLTGK
ncbi:MAG: aminodeoxychorismate lyase [Candidatus Scalindua sp.]|jgi:branched-chain amino acid aminotransferase|nr:aminodeoxychorismate lyase [Candidatus Scalindua sp.]MBT5304454.1 aminodeoxychorismate lyase [Candidatus Scalindua sp.]MBT6045538.1 aminodeoxychorismate lyase [Candidatus Scalindua sp.]MBT6227051.1 aminodeoxychorismate lyase [Candidatus Scalindua sp.]MBT6563751.1 aminodeoxychorismate lyase [Candidatus Scalindua sp.]